MWKVNAAPERARSWLVFSHAKLVIGREMKKLRCQDVRGESELNDEDAFLTCLVLLIG